MDHQIHRASLSEVMALAARQHGVVTRAQLLQLGLSPGAITYRMRTGRLHAVQVGVYAVGRPELTRLGRWMAAVIGCGGDAVLSHQSAAELWQVRRASTREIEVSVPPDQARRRAGIVVHRQALVASDVTKQRGIPVTTPARTLVDLTRRLSRRDLEAAVNAADKLGLTNPPALREALDGPMSGRPGVAILRGTLDRRTFTLTDSELERLFLPIASEAGLPVPRTGCLVNGFKVDFHWPELGLVVETDGLRYHRTPAQQAADRRRDQVHTASGLVSLRFTHEQVAFEPSYVREILLAVVARLDRAV